jgi:hypothetical protein
MARVGAGPEFECLAGQRSTVPYPLLPFAAVLSPARPSAWAAEYRDHRPTKHFGATVTEACARVQEEKSRDVASFEEGNRIGDARACKLPVDPGSMARGSSILSRQLATAQKGASRLMWSRRHAHQADSQPSVRRSPKDVDRARKGAFDTGLLEGVQKAARFALRALALLDSCAGKVVIRAASGPTGRRRALLSRHEACNAGEASRYLHSDERRAARKSDTDDREDEL